MDFICNNCNATFNENNAFHEVQYHGEVHPGGTELIMTCPECGAVDYEEASYCHKCGDPFLYGDLAGGYYCRECMDELTTAEAAVAFAKDEVDCFAEFLHERMVDNA